MTNELNLQFRKATIEDAPEIWEILQQSIDRRKKDGSTQWQDGYPNLSTVENDISNSNSYVLTQNEIVVATAAVIFNFEPTYEKIEGEWLTNDDFYVVHRVGVSDKVAGKGYATKLFEFVEEFAKANQVFSIKVDTLYDNKAMLRIMEKLNYTYCGEIEVRDGKRFAFEKVLPNS